VVSSGLGAVNPLLIRRIFDDALFSDEGCPDRGLLYGLIGLMVGLAASASAIGVVKTYLAAGVGQQVCGTCAEACTPGSRECPSASSPRRARVRSSRD